MMYIADIIVRNFIWFVFYSLLGWFYETALYLWCTKKFVDKSFLNGPFCPVYGLGAAALTVVLPGLKENLFLLFILGAVITCTVEYFTAYFLEKFFSHKEWDYSTRRFNVHGRICLLGALVFGAFSVLLIRYVHPVISWVTSLIPAPYLHLFALILFTIQALDFFITFKNISPYKNTHNVIEISRA